MFGAGRGEIPRYLDDIDIIRSASDLVAASPDVAASLDRTVILRIVSLLYDQGIEDPQKLADAAFLLASSKLFTGML